MRNLEEILKQSYESLPDVVTVDDVKNFLGVGAVKAYEIINDERFTRLNLGRKKGIPKCEFFDWLEIKRMGIPENVVMERLTPTPLNRRIEIMGKIAQSYKIANEKINGKKQGSNKAKK